ncbi:CorA metal ion transporter [Coemansia sp. RSA 1290]|nr:CorA metal ion transporter [Coemansia sp. RSA 1290]KAJ2651474.1 CorA metal ion transporter [Coemansia sp. RSA 1250]
MLLAPQDHARKPHRRRERPQAKRGARIDMGALRQWAGTGEVKTVNGGGQRRRRYRLGRWHTRSMSSWNPPNTSLGASVSQMASQSRRSLVSIDICHKPSESRRASMSSAQGGSPVNQSFVSDDDMGLDQEAGPLAQLLLRENDEIWNNPNYRFTFYSPATGTVRATSVSTLSTDSADGLDGLLMQALDNDSESDHMENIQVQAPQLSVTSVDPVPADQHEEMPALMDSEFLHPHYARGKGMRLQGEQSEPSRDLVSHATSADARLFWLDVEDPTNDEIQALAQVFDLHPLTVEDLMVMREQAQDGFKSFRHYDTICYRTSVETTENGDAAEAAVDTGSERSIAADTNIDEKGGFVRDIAKRVRTGRKAVTTGGVEELAIDDGLEEPVAFYVIVLDSGVITLHHGRVSHVRNTVGRLKLDEDVVRLTPDYVAYLLLDDITDTLVPTTRLLELEVDAIDELVLILTRAEHDDVLKRIGIERRHALWLVRLLHGKAEVLRAVERRVQTKAIAPARERSQRAAPVIVHSDADEPNDSDEDALASQWLTSDEEEGDLYGLSRNGRGLRRQPAGGADVAKYLADVHDHLIALTASVHHCERILARAHGNYLARINLELTHASNTTNQLATQMTVLAGIFLPLNLVAGIFGMNVKVPGRDRDDLRDFGLIVGAMGLFVVATLAVCRWRRII